jgi:hypothetical protein
MRTKVIELTFVVLFAPAAFGQAPGRTERGSSVSLHVHRNAQGFQKIATVMRTVAGIRQIINSGIA